MLRPQPKKTKHRAYSPLRTRGTGYKYVSRLSRPRPVSDFINAEKLAYLHTLQARREHKAFKAELVHDVIAEIKRPAEQHFVPALIMLFEDFGKVIAAWKTLPDEWGPEDVEKLGHKNLLPTICLLSDILANQFHITTADQSIAATDLAAYLNWYGPQLQKATGRLLKQLPGFIGAVVEMLAQGRPEGEIREYVMRRTKRLRSSLNGLIDVNFQPLVDVVKEFSASKPSAAA